MCKNFPKGKINPKSKEHDHKYTIDQKYDQYDNAYTYDVQASDVQGSDVLEFLNTLGVPVYKGISRST